MKKRFMVRRLMSIGTIVLLTTVLLVMLAPHPALAAGISTQNCPPGYSDATYISYHCSFSSAWSKSSNSLLYLNIYISSGLPSDVYIDVAQSLPNWNNSRANVYLTQVTSGWNIGVYGQNPPGMTFDSDANCFGTWGYTTGGNVCLNYHY